MVFGSSAKEQTEQTPQRRLTLSFLHNKAAKEERKPASQSSTAIRNSSLAGLAAGITGTLVGHPLDSVKVWIQTGIKPNVGNTTSSLSILGSIRRSYAGVASPIMTVGLIQSINFAAYDSMRRYWYYHYEDPHGDPADKAYLNNDSFASVALSGVGAGVVVSAITQPVVMIKTKQQSQNMKFTEAIKHSIRHPMVGFGTHLFMETANRSIYFVVYEALKRKYSDAHGNASMTTRMTSAMAAGVACWMFIYPSDVIRSRLYSASASGRHLNAVQVVREMHAEQGWRSFFKGYTVTMLRAGPVAAVILPVYDIVLEQLNKLSF